MASSKGVPKLMVGILDSSAYDSERKFTKSNHTSRTFIVAVSRCFDCSGFDCITPTPLISSPLLVKYSFTFAANSAPKHLSKATSISFDSNPSNLSLTHPPATRNVKPATFVVAFPPSSVSPFFSLFTTSKSNENTSSSFRVKTISAFSFIVFGGSVKGDRLKPPTENKALVLLLLLFVAEVVANLRFFIFVFVFMKSFCATQ
mmetsp:Transcript_2700/g.8672  ORF Transcript_2700/g.8672 Transcript_2700/m.8672 type:complete len:203 (-) Transcript_2700:319-927(-)